MIGGDAADAGGAGAMGTNLSFSTRIQTRNGVTNLALDGELDIATVPELDTALEASERDGAGAIVVDLRELTFIDASGVRALLRAHDRSMLNGHRLLVVGATNAARRVFRITEMDHLLEDENAAALLGRFVGDGHDGGTTAARHLGGPRG